MKAQVQLSSYENQPKSITGCNTTRPDFFTVDHKAQKSTGCHPGTRMENISGMEDRKDEAFIFGDFTLYPQRRLLLKKGKKIPIRNRTLGLLIILVERAGEIVNQDELMLLGWPRVVVDRVNLRVQIHALRKIIESKDSIITVSGYGYYFAKDVARHEVTDDFSDAKISYEELSFSLNEIVGREEELKKVMSRFEDHRLISLVGPGGVGKSCVASAITKTMMTLPFFHSVFIDVPSLMKGEKIAESIASQLTKNETYTSPFEIIVESMSKHAFFLVLDGCEYRLEEASKLVDFLLNRVPQCHILVTSREPLFVDGEVLHQLSPLSVPSEHLDSEEILTYPAVRLFIERASTYLTELELHSRDILKVGAITRKLDGLPLAIEIVASKIAIFGLNELETLIDGVFLLRMSGRRTAQPRHYTLGNMLEWSYNMLTANEKWLLGQLASFKKFTSLDDIIQSVDTQDIEIAELHFLVESLASKSMLSIKRDNLKRYYYMLEATKIFMHEKLSHKKQILK
ncbi:NB-ARC domain-containing protein [Halomonas binhaiensis]|uniref:Winged helix-turn-helix domain-containing protein n=1 Tax=Halomonas binhaiensis TaxID=2562282 RepID=A0A5C1NHF7_9GAMM|nr:NB-ARC domain-containing protein [Halomonas binhaiensis]QEM82261.1 winged helix-turn-helix domain-containing protein [Halomonas binhaiensis]